MMRCEACAFDVHIRTVAALMTDAQASDRLKVVSAAKPLENQLEGVKGEVEDEEPRFPTGPRGRLETIAEREAREAHNLKMRFNRTFESHLT